MNTIRKPKRLRHAVRIAALLGVALAVGLGCASTRPLGEQASDKSITAKIESKLAGDPQVNPFEIDVDTRDGVVRLSGMVESSSGRDEAEKLARDTAGVRDVVNEIRIGDPSFEENVSDAWIVTKIKAKLTGDPQINPFNIDVDADQGAVTLSGTVAKQAARDEAERLARDTRGVKSVRNLIDVRTDS